MHRLTFRNLEASNDEDYWMVVFGKAADGSQAYVMLQLAKEPDDQDRALALDDIYLEINDQRHGAYGAVRAIELGNRFVRLTLDPECLSLSADVSPMDIRFTGADSLFAVARDLLVKMGQSAKVTLIEA